MESCVTPCTVALWRGTTMLHERVVRAHPQIEDCYILVQAGDGDTANGVSGTFRVPRAETTVITGSDGDNLASSSDAARNNGTTTLSPAICGPKRHSENVLAVINTAKQSFDDN